MDFEGLAFQEACWRLNIKIEKHKYKAPKIPKPAKKRSWSPADPDPAPGGTWLEKAHKFVVWAHGKLLKDAEKLDYLKERGIHSAAIVNHQLGFNPGQHGKDLFRHRESWGLDTVFKKNGQKKRMWIPRGLIIPWIDNDRIMRIRIRRDEGEPRYYVLPGSNMGMMLLGSIKRVVLVVESELDAILISQEAGDVSSALALGSSSSKPDRSAAQRLRSATLVLLALDYDQAGAGACRWWQNNFPQTKRWPVPVGKDPGEAHQAGTDLRDWIIAGFPAGWRIGRFPFGKNERKEGKSILSGGLGIGHEAIFPEKVREFARLIQGIPVFIYHTPERVSLRFKNGWDHNNWDKAKEIAHRLYFDPIVFSFIENHPLRKVTPENIYKRDERYAVKIN